MSNMNKYICDKCEYYAEVWNAPDRAAIATVDTKHCLDCCSLVEVPVEFHGSALIEDMGGEAEFLNRCPDCNLPNVQPWHASHPCPKCSEHMTFIE
jgi:hypothetical protein